MAPQAIEKMESAPEHGMAPEAADSQDDAGTKPSEDFSSILAAPGARPPRAGAAAGRRPVTPQAVAYPLAREAGEDRREAPGEG